MNLLHGLDRAAVFNWEHLPRDNLEQVRQVTAVNIQLENKIVPQ